MDEIEMVKDLRTVIAEPNEVEMTKAKQQLLDAIKAEEAARARSEPLRRKFAGKWTVAAAVAVLAVPGGFAIASAIDGEDTPIIPAAECPEANAALERAGIPSMNSYAGECPSPERIEEIRIAIERDAAIREQAEAEGQFPPDQLP